MAQLTDMSSGRLCAGIFLNKFNKERVYICEGYDAPKKFEYYDINEIIWNDNNCTTTTTATINSNKTKFNKLWISNTITPNTLFATSNYK